MSRNLTLMLTIATALALAGCGAGTKSIPWHTHTQSSQVDAAQYPHANAVILKRDVHTFIHFGWSLPSYTISTYHVSMKILNEAAISESNVRVTYNENDKILGLDARVITPDGQQHLLKPDNVYEDTLSETEKNKYKVKVFALPKVSVGSIIEYQYVVKSERFNTNYHKLVPQRYPAKSLSWTWKLGDRADYTGKVYHSKNAFEAKTEGKNSVVSWRIQNVPAKPKDAQRPYYMTFLPSIKFAITSLKYGANVYYYNSDWSDAATPEIRLMSTEDLLKDLEFPKDLQLSGSKQEKTSQIHEYIMANFERSGSRRHKVRPLQEMLEQKRGSEWEISLLSLHLLRKAKITAQWALIKNQDKDKLDLKFPTRYFFDNALVYIPAQPELTEPIWLDSTCFTCRAGQLPDVFLKERALLIEKETKPSSSNLPETKWHVLPNEAPRKSEMSTEVKIALQSDGSAIFNRTLTYYGSKAFTQRDNYRNKSQEKQTEMYAKWARKNFPEAELLEHHIEDTYATERKIVVKLKYQVQNFATPTSEGLLVPLSILRTGNVEEFETETPRRAPIKLGANKFTSIIEIIGPKGKSPHFSKTAFNQESKFGKFDLSLSQEENQAIIKFNRVTNKGQWPSNTIGEVQTYYRVLHQLKNEIITFK